MKLKTATKLVVFCLIIWLLINLSQWVIFNFVLLDYSEYRWFFRILNLIEVLLYALPLINFFVVLNSKQKAN